MLVKKYVVIFILSIISRQTFSQFKLGIRGGGSAATATLYSGGLLPTTSSGGEIYFERKSIATYYGGIFLNIEMGKSLILRPGVNWSAKGWKKTFENETWDPNNINQAYHTSGDSVFSINYIEIPVNLLYSTPAGHGKAFLGVGPYIGYAINGRIKTSDGENLKLNTDSIHKLDYGLNATVGYELKFGLFIECSFSLGMTEVFKVKESLEKRYWSKIDYSTKNRVFQLGIGYKFNIRKK